MSAAAAAAYDPPIYLTLGHGDDDIDVNFESRLTLPEGYTLITLAQCGVVTTQNSVFPMMDAFTDPGMKELLKNPRANKAAISHLIDGMDINIYSVGDSIPNLGLHLFLEWIEKATAAGGAGAGADANADAEGPAAGASSEELPPKLTPKFNVQRSGIYKFPVTNFNMKGSATKKVEIPMGWNIFNEPVAFKNKESVKNMFEDSLLPTVAEIDSILDVTKNNLKKFKKSTYHPLSSVFTKLGHGIYYFVVCRSIKSDNELSNYGNLTRQVMGYNKNDENTNSEYVPKILINSNSNKFEKNRNNYKFATNKVKYYPKIFPYILESTKLIRNPKSNEYFLNPFWNSAYLNEPRLLKHKYRSVMRTRRKSLNQQSKYAAEGASAASAASSGSDVINFKALNEHSLLEEVLSELPNLKMKGVNYNILHDAYEETIRRYPQYRKDINNEMYRVVIDSIRSTIVPKLREVSEILGVVRRIFEAHPELIKAVDREVKKGGIHGGGARKTRKQMKN